MVTVVETQFVGDPSHHSDASASTYALLGRLNLFFALFFAAELAINAFARWYRRFAGNPWNWFDALFVAMAIGLNMTTSESEDLLTSLQAIGVLRMLGRVPRLRKVVSALAMALLPVFSVFLVLVLFICIGAASPAAFLVGSIARL